MTGPGPTAAEIEALLTIASRAPDHGELGAAKGGVAGEGVAGRGARTPLPALI